MVADEPDPPVHPGVSKVLEVTTVGLVKALAARGRAPTRAFTEDVLGQVRRDLAQRLNQNVYLLVAGGGRLARRAEEVFSQRAEGIRACTSVDVNAHRSPDIVADLPVCPGGEARLRAPGEGHKWIPGC